MRGTPRPWALLLLLLSCATPETRETAPPPLPAQWTASTALDGHADGGPWWRSFGGTLGDLVEEAWRANPDLAAAAAAVRAAEAQARVAAGARLPALGGGLQARRARQNFVGFPIPGAPGSVLSTTSTTYGLSLDLSWEVDLWGRLGAAARAGHAAAEASVADLRAARLSLAGQVLKIGLAIAEASSRRQTLQAVRRNQSQALASIDGRFREGLGLASEVRLARAALAGTDALLAGIARQEQALRRQLETLLGRYPAGRLDGLQRLPGLPAGPAPGLPATVLAHRPDVAAAEARLRESRARLDEANAALYPRLALSTSGGTVSAELADLLDGDFRVWSWLGNLTAPIFQGGSLRAGADLAAAGVDAASASFASVVLRACAEVETALQAEADLAAVLDATGRAAAESRAAEELARRRYVAGVADALTLLEAERRRLEAELDLLTVQRQRLEVRVDLYLALGGAPGAGEVPQAAAGGRRETAETR